MKETTISKTKGAKNISHIYMPSRRLLVSIFLLLILSLVTPLIAFNMKELTCSFSTHRIPYLGGNGKDTGVLNFINYPELQNIVGNNVRGTRIAIIDSGLDPDVFQRVKSDYPYVTVDYYKINYAGTQIDHLTDLNDWEDGSTRWINATHEIGGHGSWVFSTAVQIARYAHYYIFDVTDWTSPSVYAISAALEYISDNLAGPDLVVSMSFGSESDPDNWYSLCGDLYYQEVTLVAAKGNNDANKKMYPADWSWAISVGACFDDTKLVDGTLLSADHKGRRVSVDFSDDYLDSPWGSNYGRWLEHVAPGFDIEAIGYWDEGNQGGESYTDTVSMVWDGTSAAAPISAAITAVIKYYYNQYHGNYRFYVAELLGEAAELTTTTRPAPEPDYYTYGHNLDRGSGILDIYDAYQIIPDY